MCIRDRTTYSVAYTEPDGGTINVSPAKAVRGKTVRITLTPDEGYTVSQVIVRDKNGRTIRLTWDGDLTCTFVMPLSQVSVEAFFSQTEAPKDIPFSDVGADAWYFDAVQYCYQHHIIKGVSEAVYAPSTISSRGMLLTVLYRLEGEPNVSDGRFNDVADGAYYAAPISWAANQRIVAGYGNGNFGPEDPLTREQLLLILYKYAALKDVSISEMQDLSMFPDAAQVSDWARPAMKWATAIGLVRGTDVGRLEPQKEVTRAETAELLYRFLIGIQSKA